MNMIYPCKCCGDECWPLEWGHPVGPHGINFPGTADAVFGFATGTFFHADLSDTDILGKNFGGITKHGKLDFLWCGSVYVDRTPFFATNGNNHYPSYNFPGVQAALDYLDAGGTIVVYMGKDPMSNDSGIFPPVLGDDPYFYVWPSSRTMIEDYNTFLSAIGSGSSYRPMRDLEEYSLMVPADKNLFAWNPDNTVRNGTHGMFMGENYVNDRYIRSTLTYGEIPFFEWSGATFPKNSEWWQAILQNTDTSSWVFQLPASKTRFPANYFGGAQVPYERPANGGMYTYEYSTGFQIDDFYREGNLKVPIITVESINGGKVITCAGPVSASMFMNYVTDLHRPENCRVLSVANDSVYFTREGGENADGETLRNGVPSRWSPGYGRGVSGARRGSDRWTSLQIRDSRRLHHSEILTDGDPPTNAFFRSRPNSGWPDDIPVIQTASQADTTFMIRMCSKTYTPSSIAKFGDPNTYNNDGLQELVDFGLTYALQPHIYLNPMFGQTSSQQFRTGHTQLGTNDHNKYAINSEFGQNVTHMVLLQNTNLCYSKSTYWKNTLTDTLSVRFTVKNPDGSTATDEFADELWVPVVPAIFQKGKWYADLESVEKGSIYKTNSNTFGNTKIISNVRSRIVKMKDITDWPNVVDAQPDLTTDGPMFSMGYCGVSSGFHEGINLSVGTGYEYTAFSIVTPRQLGGREPVLDLIHDPRTDRQEAWDLVAGRTML